MTTKTIGPLHFEDLDPKRFEDLVRQLIYDFKSWRRLEATGRSGSDDGFDARGFEICSTASSDDEEAEEFNFKETDRLWLIQCKREHKIPPNKLSIYLDDIRLRSDEHLHGLIFVAACDFSKKSRDLFRQRCEAMGVQEWFVWGKAELEDMLFQPKNDSLLFAYFGISIAIKQRTLKHELRSRISMKRKAHRLLEHKENFHILLRSPYASEYPHSHSIPNFLAQPKWVLRAYRGMYHDGLLFCVRRHFAFLSDDAKEWDAALIFNDCFAREDPWNEWDRETPLRKDIFEFWSAFPERNKAWLEVIGHIPFESIFEIDELGDEIVSEPHVYVPFNGRLGPFTGFHALVEPSSRFLNRGISPKSNIDRRVVIFNENWRIEPHGETINAGKPSSE